MRIKIYLLSIIIVLNACEYLPSFESTPEPTKKIDTVYINQFATDGKFPHDYRIITPKFPEKLDFSGEKVPLENRDVYEKFEREIIVNTYWHSATVLYLKRANRWFPVIEPILKKNKIPEDFKYVAVIESGLDNVVSPARAVGFWQFLKGTAKDYSLEVNDEVDERYHVEKATAAACKYIWDAYLKFGGSWTLAAASYNMGRHGVFKQLARQKANNYYNIVLNEETTRYMFRILALKEIMQNPQKYGFDIPENDLYPQYETRTINISSSVKDFAEFAEKFQINYKVLKQFNPWLRTNYLRNNRNKTYIIKLPVKTDPSIVVRN